MNREPDWALWRSFAAVISEGSLSAAARHLSMSQPTIGRHIETLEANLGIPLFERTLTGLKPNETALRLYEPVQRAQNSLAEAAILAEGAQDDTGGTVRITASFMISNYVLPKILGAIRKAHPRIGIEVVPSDSAENLLMREADIAVRMFRPTQLELVTRHLGDIPSCPSRMKIISPAAACPRKSPTSGNMTSSALIDPTPSSFMPASSASSSSGRTSSSAPMTRPICGS
ncbi:LysR family transcriptional regulator [Devosia chinhatensis]|uniref:LysR family transcriptional regulator n=1 Tax=Devosia aurantiaca TaxID=2714858 RepID=A0A6M1SGN5_9HYPH|nr:LysR family transcriptional regulator [Devosia aurantiaca]